jgi:hypothetical protein
MMLPEDLSSLLDTRGIRLGSSDQSADGTNNTLRDPCQSRKPQANQTAFFSAFIRNLKDADADRTLPESNDLYLHSRTSQMRNHVYGV